jgi:hypothetical protein
MKLTRFSLLPLVILAVSPSVRALDLTGTWTGKLTCTAFSGNNPNALTGEKFSYTLKNQALQISQAGRNLSLRWIDLNQQSPTLNFTGIVIDRTSKPDTQGRAAIADCDTDPNLASPSAFSEITSLDAKVNRGKGKGTLTGTSVYSYPTTLNAPKEVGQCKWSFKLSNTTNPNVAPGCP